ncbi:MAG TPA: hypothetical protein VGF62_05580 [Rhizomicrobium sp.]|jgi:hypothetical protein|nr:hypothetical protein [Rhizomicrobium sp.]
MTMRLVDVFDRGGAKLFTYSIALEDTDCLDAEFEEVALIFAESSGLVAQEEIVHLRATCEPCAIFDEPPVSAAEPKRMPRRKGAVVSLVKHRMKRTGTATERQRIRHVS